MEPILAEFLSSNSSLNLRVKQTGFYFSLLSPVMLPVRPWASHLTSLNFTLITVQEDFVEELLAQS